MFIVCISQKICVILISFVTKNCCGGCQKILFPFQNVSNLTHLDLSHNSLSSLPNDLFYFTVKLEALSLAHNPLVELDLSTSQALATLTGLRYLNLAYCGLR